MTDDELKALVARLALAQEKTDVQLAKTDEKLVELIEQHQKTEAGLAELQQTVKQVTIQSSEQRQKTEAGLADLQQTVKQVTTQLGEMGHIQGDVAEDWFRRNIVPLLAERGIKVKKVGFHVSLPGTAEYDIVAENGKEVVVLEVKNKLSVRHIRRFIKVQLPRFKCEFPMYADYKLYGALGSLVVLEELEQPAINEGLLVLTQTQDGGASIVNPPDFQAKIW